MHIAGRLCDERLYSLLLEAGVDPLLLNSDGEAPEELLRMQLKLSHNAAAAAVSNRRSGFLKRVERRSIEAKDLTLTPTPTLTLKRVERRSIEAKDELSLHTICVILYHTVLLMLVLM